MPGGSDDGAQPFVEGRPTGARGSITHSAANAPTGIAAAPACLCPAGRAASSGSSRSVSIRTPWRRAAAGVSKTAAAANSPEATRRSSSGVRSSLSPTVPAVRLRDPRRRLAAQRPVADGQRARSRLGRAARVVDRRVDLGERAPRALEQRRARGRQLDVAGGPEEEDEAELALDSRIARDNGDCDMCSRSAARPKCSSSATATK